jgi:type IV secretion system protein VirB9
VIADLIARAENLGVAALVSLALAGGSPLFCCSSLSLADVFRGQFPKELCPQQRRNAMKSLLSSVAKGPMVTAVVLLAMFVAGFEWQPPAWADGARVVKYGKEDIVPIHAKLRFSTLIVLPEDEEILDFTTGDREFWIINGSHNLCYVHPSQAGIHSNLNLITASGRVYSFLLTEISSEPSVQPDLKLFVEPKETSASNGALRGYVRVADAEAYKKELESLRTQTAEQIRAAQLHAAEEVNQFRSTYATKLQFDYTLDAKAEREPFLVSAIYHDGKFTYVRCGALEKPALYETKDGKPNLVPFQVENGVYIVPKIVDSGYLVVGKKRVNFTRQIAAK